MTEKLELYRSKRDFSRTAEPSGSEGASPGECLYVMHKHAASHDHFDLRLEQDGVLRSWALPKGPSLEPGEKRLAVEVEDHPLEYGEFEGVIPREEYGGGTIMLWDRGRWRQFGKSTKDKLDFELQGAKLTGHWTLVRMRGKPTDRNRGDRDWLLIKRTDETGQELNPDDLSIVSGRSMEEIAREEKPKNKRAVDAHDKAVPDPSRIDRARRAELRELPSPQLATLVETAPEGEDWIHEIKYDGYRLLAWLDKGEATIITRNGKDWTRRFPELAEALATLPVQSALIDGEIASFDENGAASFRRLQESLANSRRRGHTGELVFLAFDLLYLNGYDLRNSPLLERKRTLEQLLQTLPQLTARVRYSDHVQGHGADFHEQVCQLGLEGMVSKRADARYRSGRQGSWVKVKCTAQDEFVVGGYTRPSGARSGFGSLLLGAFGKKGLDYVGRVGSGFTQRQLDQLHRTLRQLETDSCPFETEVPGSTGARWVEPNLVVDVEFTERTGSGVLRHPVFRGLREDKDPATVRAKPESPAVPPARIERGTAGSKRGKRGDQEVAGIKLSHADRILYPEQGVTKLELARYYEDIQEWILPHLASRPLVLLRCPEGWEQECFFQKHPGKNFASGVPRIAIRENDDSERDYVYVRTISDVIALVQFNVLEFHPWGSQVESIEMPDTIIFDLDPGPDVSWARIAGVAMDLRERLDGLGLASFLQATGGKGLHLIVPLKPGSTWDEVKQFSHAVSRAHAQDDPRNLTTNMAKKKRQGRIFLDYLRNGRGSTSIGRYSLRARKNAPVATPLRWDELTSRVNSNRYTISNIRRRLGALREDPWKDYEASRVAITSRMRRQVGLEKS
ncbi:DNA ligase D [Kineobactrum sediminis]|uniref:DNA ligase D n=1 Tax=Kineobactrum sediminis TaxID=1905677 RepID=UPI0019D474C2|nr:DNA ligase D [Kineobactrum sediminis]